MRFKIQATTAFMKGKLGNVRNEWVRVAHAPVVRCDEADPKRDFKIGEPLTLVESTDGKDWRWVAERNLIPLEN